jgi:hypothetical protein
MINKIIKIIGVDKLLHFLCGMIIGLIALIILKSAVSAIFLAFFIGLLKEGLAAQQVDNRFDWLNLLWTIGGGIAGSLFTVFL